MPTLSDNMTRVVEELRVSGADLWKMTPVIVGADLSVLAKHLYWMGMFQQTLLDEGWVPKDGGLPAADDQLVETTERAKRPTKGPWSKYQRRESKEGLAALLRGLAAAAECIDGIMYVRRTQCIEITGLTRRFFHDARKRVRSVRASLPGRPHHNGHVPAYLRLSDLTRYIATQSRLYSRFLSVEEAMDVVNTELKKLNKEAA